LRNANQKAAYAAPKMPIHIKNNIKETFKTGENYIHAVNTQLGLNPHLDSPYLPLQTANIRLTHITSYI